MKILGIETSCDETAASVVEDGNIIHSNCIYSQISKHKPFGGVVPEIASRNHVVKLPEIINASLEQARIPYKNLDAIAVTYGPGLASSLVVGYSSAKSLSLRLGIPLIGVNHHAGHLYSVFMQNDLIMNDDFFPMISLMVSGGDTSIILIKSFGEFNIIGRTIDDAAGEALDKASAILNLGYPGGPIIQKISEDGDQSLINFPRGLNNKSKGRWLYDYNRDLCFSFSGLKTSLLTYVNKKKLINEEFKINDIAASFQQAIVESLVDRIDNALDIYKVKSFACAGGVSLNKSLRKNLNELSIKRGIPLLLSPPSLCTDNAAMISGVAYEMVKKSYFNTPIDVSPSLRLHNWF